MDYEKLNLIKQDILSVPFEPRLSSTEFCSLYVEGRDTFKFEDADATFHAFRRFSQYEYPNYVFLGLGNSKEEVDKLLKKYPYTFVYACPPLNSLIEYSQWMIRCCFWLLPNNVSKILTHQMDGFLVSEGWEDYVIRNNFDYIGAPWKEPIKLKENVFNFPAVTVGNGGVSVRDKNKMLDVMNLVNQHGGQKIVQGIYINNILRHNHMYVFEDIFFSFFGFGSSIFRPVSNEQALRFAVEPITLKQYQENRNRYYAAHKIDE